MSDIARAVLGAVTGRICGNTRKRDVISYTRNACRYLLQVLEFVNVYTVGCRGAAPAVPASVGDQWALAHTRAMRMLVESGEHLVARVEERRWSFLFLREEMTAANLLKEQAEALITAFRSSFREAAGRCSWIGPRLESRELERIVGRLLGPRTSPRESPSTSERASA